MHPGKMSFSIQSGNSNHSVEMFKYLLRLSFLLLLEIIWTSSSDLMQEQCNSALDFCSRFGGENNADNNLGQCSLHDRCQRMKKVCFQSKETLDPRRHQLLFIEFVEDFLKAQDVRSATMIVSRPVGMLMLMKSLSEIGILFSVVQLSSVKNLLNRTDSSKRHVIVVSSNLTQFTLDNQVLSLVQQGLC